ncbi:AraC family transcriptional regulator ligand-binding domain-containing protein [Pseudomonas sp. PDM23]|uniref:helix-turn-helix transcriptional regulator n=1 Tax=unclassified Pseudomonas TaxID=196821 RepID=UPI001783C3B5|nr:AraC family transcriptional regulator ligand-binding domain-containing protein [Pseudomonas sp. PDM17]MBD9575784.1 AraC family transcriptional regulator ligand-binding domain-containing protein [Pseudomonas sp. PDM23]MBD9669271.1 AraC family transcriptional regulator ligand-binding domain-containing protein [Pseudomonas sp. PDM21]
MRISLTKVNLNRPSIGCSDKEGSQLAHFGELRYLMTSAPTVGDALESLARYMSSCIKTVQCRLERVPSHAQMHFECACPSQGDGLVVETWMLHTTRLIGILLGRPFSPQQTTFRHGPLGDRGNYLKRFGCPALFRQRNNSLVLSSATLDEVCTERDPTLHSIMRFYIESQTSYSGHIQELVTAHILRLMPLHQGTLDLVSQALGMNPRTLQRRLADERTDFEQLLDNVRRSQALHLLQQTNIGINEIASALGYRRTGSFCRAHKRWFGVSPAEFRSQFSAQLVSAGQA